MLLANPRQGEVVKIEGFVGGPRFEARMLSMGLGKGKQAKASAHLGQGEIVAAIENK